MRHDPLTEIIDSVTELKRMSQLNLELLEQLAVTCNWLRNCGIRLPNENALDSLLNKTIALLNEIQADEPKTLQYKKIPTDEILHGHKTAKDFTEPERCSVTSSSAECPCYFSSALKDCGFMLRKPLKQLERSSTNLTGISCY